MDVNLNYITCEKNKEKMFKINTILKSEFNTNYIEQSLKW